MKELFYKFYKRFDDISSLSTIAYYTSNVILPKIIGKNKSCKYDSKNIKFLSKKYGMPKYYKDIKIAFVCDEMTYKSFKDECDAVFLTPSNWLEVMESFQPDIFFCESAWNGIDKYRDCWRGRIYKNKNVLFNNRKDIFNILDYCKKSGIKTVFWNKEDPIYFDHYKHNFSDTAINFDYIFTTSSECVEKYKNLGHRNVYTLMFGFNQKIFNPINSNKKENVAVFAGSWYADLKERCIDIRRLFNLVLENKIELRIYDRNYNTSNPLKVFPKEFNSVIFKNIPFEKLKNIYRNASYVININTVKNSETMFARRVFEIMACNTCVISNESLGMKKMFGNNVWFVNEQFDTSSSKKICEQNVQYVMENHTNSKRIRYIYDTIGLEYIDDNRDLAVIYKNCSIIKCRNHFKDISYKKKNGYIFNNGVIISIDNERKVMDMKTFIEENKANYFIVFEELDEEPIDINKTLVHFSYLNGFVGISDKGEKFIIKKSNDYYNCVFESKYLKMILLGNNIIFNRYIV